MAAAVIPIIAAAAPLLTPLIQRLVLGVESLLGPKTGPAKSAAVVGALQPIVSALSTAGAIPGQLDPASLTAMVESVVQALSASGVLNPQAAGAILAQPVGVSTMQPGTLRIVGGTLQLQFQ